MPPISPLAVPKSVAGEVAAGCVAQRPAAGTRRTCIGRPETAAALFEEGDQAQAEELERLEGAGASPGRAADTQAAKVGLCN